MAEKPPQHPSGDFQPSPGYVPLSSNRSDSPASLTPLSTSHARNMVKFQACSIFFLCLCVIDLAIPYWFRYCRRDVGLIGYNESGYSETFDATIRDCDGQQYESFCDGFCNRTKELRVVGGIMLGLGATSMFCLVVAMIRLLILSVNPNRTYGKSLIRWALVSAAGLWWCGTLPYIGIFAKISHQTTHSTFVEAGVPLAIFIAVWHVGNCIVGMRVTDSLIEALPVVAPGEGRKLHGKDYPGSEMEREERMGFESITPEFKRYAIIFSASSVCAIAIAIAAFSLKRWVRFCDVETSLTTVYTDDDHSYSYARVIQEVCPYRYDSESCGNICFNLKNLRNSAKVMLAFGIPSITLLAAAVAWTLALAFNVVRVRKVCLLRVVMVASLLLWAIATIVYISLVVEIRIDSERVSVGAGLGLCFVVAAAQVWSCWVGNLALNKLSG